MNPDLSLSPDFSPLALDNSYGTLLAGYDFTTLPAVSQPASDPNKNTSNFQTVLSSLTALFDGGVAAYNSVARQTGLPLANGAPTAPATVAAQAAAAPAFAGLTASQLQLILGGAALVGVLLILKRR